MIKQKMKIRKRFSKLTTLLLTDWIVECWGAEIVLILYHNL